MTQKSLIKMQISPVKNQKFEKPFQSEDFEKQIFWISLKNFGSAYAQSLQKCSNIEILVKIEGKEAKFFSKIYRAYKDLI
jgi:hypothetical protein